MKNGVSGKKTKKCLGHKTQELNHGGRLYCVRELGVHVSSNLPQKGFQQVSDEAN